LVLCARSLYLEKKLNCGDGGKDEFFADDIAGDERYQEALRKKSRNSAAPSEIASLERSFWCSGT